MNIFFLKSFSLEILYMSAMKQDQIYPHVIPYLPPTSFSVRPFPMTISMACYPLPFSTSFSTPPLPMKIFTPCYLLSTPKSLSTPPHLNFVFFFEQSATISFFVFFSQVTLAVCFEFVIRVVPWHLELISPVGFCCG